MNHLSLRTCGQGHPRVRGLTAVQPRAHERAGRRQQVLMRDKPRSFDSKLIKATLNEAMDVFHLKKNVQENTKVPHYVEQNLVDRDPSSMFRLVIELGD